MKFKVSRLRRACHWLIAASVFFLLISSWWMLALPLPSEDFTYRQLPFQLHKNIGITIFLLALLITFKKTLGFRHLLAGEGYERSRQLELLRFLGHYFLYAILLACCISGYLSSSYSGWGTEFWWLLSLQNWAQENDELNEFYSDIHLWSCWLLVFFVIAHITAAFHHALRNDGAIDSFFKTDS